MIRVALVTVVCLVASGCADDSREEGVPEDVTTMRFDLARGLDPDLIFERGAPADWQPDPDPNLEQLPYPWPDQFVEQHDQLFHPSSYRANASMLCTWAKRNPDRADEVAPIAEALFGRMMDYTEVQGDARFIIYDFDRAYEGHELKAGWVSAYGNGAAIAGTLVLDRCWPDERYVEVAYELAEAYSVTSRDGLWFTRVTPEGFLWFEEIPVDDEPQMILNGHITAVTGLYYLWDREGQDPEILERLQAGITSVHRYGREFRRPGQINCYDLSPPCHDDYGPERTVRQQDLLFEMTGHDRFRQLRDDFAEDMDIDVTQLGQTGE